MKMVAGARLDARAAADRRAAPVRGEDRRGPAVGRARTMSARAPSRTDEPAAPAPRAAARRRRCSIVVLHGRPRPLRRVQHEHQQGAPSASGARRRRRARGRASSPSAARGASTSPAAAGKIAQDFPQHLRRARPRRRRALVASWHRRPASRRRVRRGLPRLQRVQERDHPEGRRRARSCRSPRRRGATRTSAARPTPPTEFIFEPNQRALLERLVPMYVEITHLPRAPREPGELLRRADDGDGRGDAQREGDDRAADARVQPRAAGGDHQGADGDHRRRRGAEGLNWERDSETESRSLDFSFGLVGTASPSSLALGASPGIAFGEVVLRTTTERRFSRLRNRAGRGPW